MRTNRIVIWLALLCLAACHADETIAPVKSAAGFTVTGVVRDEAGTLVSGALATLGGSDYTFTNGAGVFRIDGVRGDRKLLVAKESYDDFSRELTVTGDVFVEVVLTAIAYADSLVLGEALRSNVASNATPCDPIHWDARAPCRRFKFRAPETGVLSVTVVWDYGSPLDVVITTENGTYLASSGEDELPRASVSARVARGEVYEVRVNSYYEAQVFDLRAELYTDAITCSTLGAGEIAKRAIVPHELKVGVAKVGKRCF